MFEPLRAVAGAASYMGAFVWVALALLIPAVLIDRFLAPLGLVLWGIAILLLVLVSAPRLRARGAHDDPPRRG